METDSLKVADIATTGSIIFGFCSILIASYSTSISAILILGAVLLDGLDGYLARRYNSAEDGLMFDTLADVVSFTVAPSVLIFYVLSENWSVIISGPVACIFILAGIIHLRRFVRCRETLGCQTTVASILVALSAGVDINGIIVFATIVGSILMLRTVEYPGNIPMRSKLTGGILVIISSASIYTGFYTTLVILPIWMIILSFMTFSPHIQYFE